MWAWKENLSLTTPARTIFLHFEYINNTHKPGDWSSKGSCYLNTRLPFPSHLIRSPKQGTGAPAAGQDSVIRTHAMCSRWGPDSPFPSKEPRNSPSTAADAPLWLAVESNFPPSTQLGLPRIPALFLMTSSWRDLVSVSFPLPFR